MYFTIENCSVTEIDGNCEICGYIQLGIDIGSSTVARGVVSLVLGYLNNLVIEMAFLVQVEQPSIFLHNRQSFHVFHLRLTFYS